MDDVIHEMASSLEVFERDDTLAEAARFGARVDALDAIEFDVIERIRGLPVIPTHADAFASLQARADGLRQRLEEADERLYSRLREAIAAGELRGNALRRALICYAGPGLGRTKGYAEAYDRLDALIGGLLLGNMTDGSPLPQRSLPLNPEMVGYQPTPARVVLEMVDTVGLGADDLLYDLGSGLGQVVILVHLLTGARAKGVEVVPAYCDYAARCAQRLSLTQLQFINADARAVDYRDGTAFFLYTPFAGRMLTQVLARLEALARQRPIRLFSYGPCTGDVARQPWLTRTDRHGNRPGRLATFASR